MITAAACHRATLSLLAALGLVSASRSEAQGDTISLTRLVQFTVPATPALTFIGASTEKISRPTAPKDFAALLSNAIDESGRVIQGLAVELSPKKLLIPRMDAEGYRRRAGFITANTAISVGTIKATGDSSSTNLGIGLRSTILDRSDPMTADGSATVLAALQRCAGSAPVPRTGPERARFISCLASADSAFRADFRRDHWNDWGLTIGIATGMQLADSEWGRGRRMGWAANGVLAAPLCLSAGSAGLCGHGQWLVQVGYEQRDSIVGAPKNAEAVVVGARSIIGSDTFGFFAEILWARDRGKSSASGGNGRDWSTGIEFRVSDELWATTGVGARYSELLGKEKAVLIAGLRASLLGQRKLGAMAPGRGG